MDNGLKIGVASFLATIAVLVAMPSGAEAHAVLNSPSIMGAAGETIAPTGVHDETGE